MNKSDPRTIVGAFLLESLPTSLPTAYEARASVEYPILDRGTLNKRLRSAQVEDEPEGSVAIDRINGTLSAEDYL